MLHRTFGALSGLGFSGFFAFLVGWLQSQMSNPQASNAALGLWFGAGASLVMGIVCGVGWWCTREESGKPENSSQQTLSASADHAGTAIVAAGDIRIGEYHAGPVQSQHEERATPSFDLTHRQSPDSFVHLLLSNFSTPSEFHVDVVEVEAATLQTVPYPVKWRDYPGEDRRVVNEALIDLAEAAAPRRCLRGGGIIIISPYDEGNDDWQSGYFTLFSFSKQDGWPVRGRAFSDRLNDIPDEFSFFFEEVRLAVRATRIDSGEEMTRLVTLGFEPPQWDEKRPAWVPSKAIRVNVEAVSVPRSANGGRLL